MEHSLLHGLQICGMIFALGGLFFRTLILNPVLRRKTETFPEFQQWLDRWIAGGALAAGLAALADLFVQTAELDGRTVLAGVEWTTLQQYLGTTTVGQIALARTLLLLVAAALLRFARAAGLILLVAGVVSFALVSHSAALPQQRTATIASQVIHMCGAAFWLGMLAFLALCAARREFESAVLPALVRRFSPFALCSVAVILVSGIYSTVRFIASPGAVVASAYGLTLLLKLALFGLAGAAGYVNWRVPPSEGYDRARFLRLLEFELTAGVLLLLVAGILGAISPPSEPGVAQLTRGQVAALLSPRLPPTTLVNPASFVGASERSNEDLRYAEFTHQWSGIAVMLLGICWLGQSIGGSGGKFLAHIWPFLLLPFGLFIAIVADPEVWILRTFSWGDVLSNPQVLEHQIGALLVFGLAALGFADRKRPPELRPLGHAFPVVMLCGSLMLLGHAHSDLGVSEELSSIINLEHAVIGSLGLIAGMSRWFQLRDLPGAPLFRSLWPSCLIVLGLFMGFFYRELTTTEPPSQEEGYSMISRLRG